MAMVCPQCTTVYEQQERICPTCSIQLMFYARLAPTAPAGGTQYDDNGQWQQTAGGRILISIVLAQGLALGLKQLLTAGFLAGGEDASTVLWGTLTGLVLLHSFHLVGLLIGGALAGAGQERGALYGSLVGLGNGILFVVLQPRASQLLSDAAHFGQPLVHVIFGAVGGWIGQAIWKPTPRLRLPETKATAPAAPMLVEMRWLHGPISWWRVLAGATLMTCGAVWSNLILTWMIDNSQGALSLTTHFQARLASWEIAGLSMLAGACLAGSNTWNGMKQGLAVGIAGAILYIGYQLANPKVILETVVFAVMCMLGLGLAGGWFGSQLFPPLGRTPRKRRLLDL